MDEKTIKVLAEISESLKTIALAEKVSAECILAMLHSTDSVEERRIRDKFRIPKYTGENRERRK